MEIVNIQFTSNQDGYQQYEPKDLALLNTVTITNPFGSNQDYVEYFLYDINGNLLTSNYFVDTYTPVNPDPVTGTYTAIEVDPEGDVRAEGYNRGSINISYNFFRKLFNSDITKTFWIKEISGDRTELRVCRQDISNIELQQAFTDYTNLVSLKAYYPDFYLNFGDDNIIIGVNVLYALQDEEGCLLIKLYEPLPDDIGLKDTFWIVDKLSDSANFNVNIEVPVETSVEVDTLRGPNYNVDIIEKVGQTTPYYTYSSILQTDLSASYQQLKSLMEEKGLDINVDYTNFANFVHFSSATERIYNFAYKVQQIESYTNDIAALETVASNGGIVSGSKQILQNNINTIIEKFDGYEYYLYYTSASDAWPKSGSVQPYTLYSVTSSQALNWLGGPSTEPSTDVYSILYTAAEYDNTNPDALTNTVPNYIKDDTANTPYLTFLNMVGQHFDNIWIYLKDVTEKYDAENNLDKGISKDLVGDALRSLGIKLYTNTSISDNIYYSLLAINPDGSLTPPTGNEVINYYIPYAANGLYVVSEYVDPDYVDSFVQGTTIAGDDITKEYYKRLYHNVPYLLKTKGTMRGLKALINCFGIPDTILRINEYGGSDKLEATADLVQRRHSLAYYNSGSATLRLPWVGQNYYYISGGLSNVLPDTIEFRFKSAGIPNTTHVSQSVFQIGSGPTTQLGLNLTYDTNFAVPSSSYENYGAMRLFLSGTQGYAKTSPILLPFYDTDLWWNVMIKREVGSGQAQSNTTSNRYWVYAKSTAYDEEGNATIAFQGSQSIYVDGAVSSSYNSSWNTFNTSSYNSMFAAYLGGTGSNSVLSPNNVQFQGYFQEFRYWATPLSESAFNEHVINSTSYKGNSTTASLFDLTFRIPLGSNLNIPYVSTASVIVNQKDYDLYELGIVGINSSASLSSYHPAITGTFILPFNGQQVNSVPSFISGSTVFSYGLFGGINDKYFQPFEITDLIPTPSTGGSQKVNNKVNVVAENNLAEDLLSPYVSIQKYDSSISKNSTDIEVGFAPSDVLDLDISNQLGYFNIDEYIGNPDDAYNTNYASLDDLKATYFEKYTSKYNVEDFIRLIKYYDNSLFKMIKDFVPARANLSTGIIVKPHILERSKYPRNEPIVTDEANWSGSIEMVSISGSNPEDMYLATSYTSSITTPLGTVTSIQTDLRQPFTGDFGGNEIQAANNYFPQTEISSILGPWTSSIQDAAIGNYYGGGRIGYIFQPGDPGYRSGTLGGFVYTVNPNGNFGSWAVDNYINTGASGTTIGTGLSNTQAIKDNDPGDTIANYVLNQNINGYTDWYVPSTDELNALYQNRVAAGIPLNDYWSSTEYASNPTNEALWQAFLNGNISFADKADSLNYIAIRNFYAYPEIFTTYSINPLENNVPVNNKSTYRLGVDYSSNPNIPVNLGLITASLAQYPLPLNYRTGNAWPSADVNDYNWIPYSKTNPRYEGSRLEGLNYNVYTGPTASWTGDRSYGNTAVIDKIKQKYAYLVNIYTASFALPGRADAQIKYLVDNDSNTINLSKTNQNIFDVQNFFKSGETIQVSLFDFNPSNPDVQILTNNKTLQLYEGGFRYSPVVYNIDQAPTLTYALTTPYVSSSTTTWQGTVSIYPGETNYWSDLTYEIDSYPTPSSTRLNLTFGDVVGGTSTETVTIPIRVDFTIPPVPQQQQPGYNVTYYYNVAIPTGETPPKTVQITVPEYFDLSYGYLDVFINTSSGGVSQTYYANVETTTNFYYTTVTDLDPDWYAVTSNTVKLSATQSLWYGLATFTGSYPNMDPVVFPLSLGPGDMVKFYNDSAQWASEDTEYRILNSQRITDDTGSFIYLTLNRPLDPVLTDTNNLPGRISHYIAMKHVPDETNLILRYAPTVPVLQDGLAIPQYIDPVVQANAGNVVQALKANNLI